MASLLEGLTWQKFTEISESESTEGKYGIPRFDGSLHLLQEYSYRVRMRAKKEKEMDPGEVKKLGPLGMRLIEGLRGPALHIVKSLKDETIVSPEKGPEAILQALTNALRPRRQQEARELYLAGSKEHGILSRQHGEPMSTYILRRRSWYAMLTDLDNEIKLPELLLAEQILMNANVTEEHQLMIRTSLNQVISVEGICNELVNQHGNLHLREKRTPQPWKFRPGGKGHQPWKGKWKNSSGYFTEGVAEDAWEDPAAEGYWGQAEPGWDSHSQSLGGCEEDLGSGYLGSESPGDYMYQEEDDLALNVFAAMVAEGLDETADQESAEYASDVIQAETEVFFARQRAQQKGHAGFSAGKRYEVRGQLSLEERKARVTALKSRTTCRACGAKGHWSGDSACPKGKGKGRPGSSSSASTSATKGPKGKGKDPGKHGSHKPRTVYFAVREDVEDQPNGYMASRGDFTNVPPPSDLDSPPQPRVATSLDGVAPTSLTEMLNWSGRAAEGPTSRATAPSFSLPSPRPVSTATFPTASSSSASATACSPPTASASSQWSLVPGKDWDHEMLFAALRENSDVVMDQLLAQARGSEQQTAGPMVVERLEDIPEPELRAVPVTEPHDLPLYRLAGVPAGASVPSEVTAVIPVPAAKETEVPEEEITVEPPTAEQKACSHDRTTTKGTNRYYFIKTCLRCRQVLEKTKKEVSTTAAASPSKPVLEQNKCPHANVTQAGTNHHVWKWYCKDCGLRKESESTAASMGYGALGNRNLEGPDTEAVKVLEMAGTVVMVQESGGMPVPLDKLPGIVAKCAEIYRNKNPRGKSSAPPMPAVQPAQPVPSRQQMQPGAAQASQEAARPATATGLAQDYGITGKAQLQAGKHKGRTFEYVYQEFPDYVDWILSQGGNIQAASLQNFERYIRARRIREHTARSQANMALEDELPCEGTLLAVLDTGCNQTCHGALWMKEYMKVKALGRRTLHIAIQLADGTLATGTVESTELEGSTAPLLLSCRAQKQLGFVLDLDEHTVYSKVFGQHLELVDRDGLPSVRLLPLTPEEGPEHFAMMAGSDQEAPMAEADTLEESEEHDYWEQQGDAWVRVHLQSRSLLYDPRIEPSQDNDIEKAVLELPYRRTVTINVQTGEQVEFREQWLQQRPGECDVTEEVGGEWTGYTFFFRDATHCNSDSRENSIPLEAVSFATFDEEKPINLSRAQRRHLQEGREGLERHDATLWAQLASRPALKAHTSQRLLPKGCRTLLLELFAGPAALTTIATAMGVCCAGPCDLMNHKLLNPEGRQELWDHIQHEDPYVLAVTSLHAPWASWTADGLGDGSPKSHQTTAERRMWYPVISWIMELTKDRARRGREVLLEAPWESLFWQLRCVERAVGFRQEATQEPIDVIHYDLCSYGATDCRTGLPVTGPTGMMTTSKAIKEDLVKHCPGHRHHQLGKGQLARWPQELGETMIHALLRELGDLNCPAVFAAEENTEEHEEFGLVDGILNDDDVGGDLPPPVDHQEMKREEHLEEEQPQGQPQFEQERKKKWLAIDRNKRLAIRRLHHMTGHASKEAMVRMLRSAGTSADVVAACHHFRCQVCQERQQPQRPSSTTTAPPYRFNHQLICDAFEVVDAAGQKHTILSLVDSGTKFHVAGRVAPGGTPSSKICADFINNAWLSWAGNPKFFQDDNPWQIGRGERHGGILKAMVKRLVTAHQLSGEMAISSAVTQSATVKNAMYNHDGYVPAQWVLGRLPHDVTSILGETTVENLGPHQETDDPETVFGRTMQIRQWAKECFIYLDSNQRIRRAMLRQAHPQRGPYQSGDIVSYCRRGRWYGPARVLTQEGKSSLWLVHGGMTLLVAETSLRPATTEEIYRKQALSLRPRWSRTPAKRKYEDFLLDEQEDLPFKERAADFDGPNQVPYFDFGPTAAPTMATEAEPRAEIEDVVLTEANPEEEPTRQVTQPEQEPLGPGPATPPTESSSTLPTPGGPEEIDGLMAFRPEQVDEVRDRRKKAAQRDSQHAFAFVGTRVEKRYRKKAVKQGAGREIVYSKASPEMQKGLDAARSKEWANWKKFTNMKTLTRAEFQELKDQDPTLRIIPTRWVDVDKSEVGQPEKLKSRFVVRGDLEDASGMRTDSPTGSQVAMGFLLTYAASTGRPLRSGDISAAFLQGSELNRKLVLSMPKGQPPEGMQEDDLVIVSTTVYGTKDAPRGWFKKLDTTLQQNKLRRVHLEPGFYVMNSDDGKEVKGLLLVHVDDLLWVGDSDMNAAMERIQQEYRFGSLDESHFKFCGRWLKQGPDGVEVTCPDLISRVRPIHLEPRRRGQRDAMATESEKSQLRSVVGSLNWLVRVCRPDMAFSVARLQTAVSRPVVQDLLDANNLVKYAARTKEKGLMYPAKKINFNDMALIAIQDASYAADFDVNRSYLENLDGHLFPVEWHSTVIRRVCKSTLQAESLSLQLGAAEGEHARAVLHGLYEKVGKLDAEQWTIGAQDRTPLVWVTDCMSLKEHLVSPTASSVSDKRLAIDLSSLRQELWREEGQLVGDPLFQDFPPPDAKTQLLWTSTDKMLADALTKRIVEHGPLMDLMSGPGLLRHASALLDRRLRLAQALRETSQHALHLHQPAFTIRRRWLKDNAWWLKLLETRQISYILFATQVTKATGDLRHFFGALFGMVVFCGRSSTSPTSTPATTATTFSASTPATTAFHYECMVRERDNEIDPLASLPELMDEVHATSRRLPEARAAAAPPVLVPDGQVFVAKYHTTAQCGHKVGHRTKSFRKCRDCP
ncbi:RE1 [Symbiodinium sp. CCMP2592]|nr:RE1 [Symbiodinium sp. CCMP2592]